MFLSVFPDTALVCVHGSYMQVCAYVCMYTSACDGCENSAQQASVEDMVATAIQYVVYKLKGAITQLLQLIHSRGSYRSRKVR